MRFPATILFAAAALLVAPATAAAVPVCAGAESPRTILSGQGVLESVIADHQGRLIFTDTSIDSLVRLDRPGASPEVIADGIDKPGGLLLQADGKLIVGQGNGFAEGAAGNLVGQAKLLRVDPETGEKETIASGLSMANGLAWGPSGEIYASDDAGTGIDRIAGGAVQRNWAPFISGNGLAVDRAGESLYVAQTFQPAAVGIIPLADPGAAATYVAAPPEDMTAGPDGMTIDRDDRLFVAANGAGEIWRVNRDRSICTLADGLLLPSAVAFGSPFGDARARGALRSPPIVGGFDHESLFAVTFSGNVIEMPSARELPGATRIRLTVSPARARAGRRVTVRFRATVEGRHQVKPLPRVRIRIAGRTVRADGRGRAVLRTRFLRAGLKRARFLSPRLRSARAEIRVLRRR